MLLGVHLCGTLSLRCVELFNDCPAFGALALKPCCLPDIYFARRGDIFASANGHTFPAAAVCVAGRWQRGSWVGSAGKEELERKYRTWVDNLGLCVDCGDDEGAAADGVDGGGSGGVVVESHRVHPVLDRFIFASRRWSADPPRGASSNDCGVDDARRRALMAEWEAKRRQVKRERRSARRSDDERAQNERTRAARETSALRIALEPLPGGERAARLRFVLEVHRGTCVPLFA
eukprot:727571-Prymnesium_polylepis.1